MPRVRTLTPGASPSHHFGSELRRARKEAGMTLADLAALVPCDASTVSRIEAGQIVPDLHFAEVCDTAFPFCRGWFSRFVTDSADWPDGTELAAAFRDFADDEREATALLVFETMVVPGLLQTEDYAREVLSRHPGVTDDLVASRVAARMERQSVLDGGVFVWALLDESVLSRDVGGQKVMHDGLLHLAGASARPNITVQVIPVGSYHVGLQGSFNLAEVHGAASSVFIEDITDGRTADDQAMVSAVALRFRHLQSLALPAPQSLAIIDKAAERWT
ncbi:MAG TPA: helix-turn-helix transcriptional regulator [Trebonia sp.]